jgi:hypothetical protein
MTLLVGTRSSRHVVISADGMSSLTQDGTRKVSRLDLQKIFPVEQTAIAVAHHGENRIDGIPVETLLPTFLSANAWTSIAQLIDALVHEFDTRIRGTLLRIQDAEKCAFWACGFSRSLKTPSIVEVEWKKEGVSINRTETKAGNLFMSGIGHDVVAEYTKAPIDGQFTWNRLRSANEKYHLRYHEKLWSIAESRQASANEQLFGGHKHTIVLTPRGWRWAIAPAK